jgi:methyl-accepting chemotaxis protein
MRIANMMKLTYGITLGLTLVTVGALTMLDRSVEAERVARLRQAEFKQLGIDLADASDFLTDEARRYAVSGDKRHFDSYWREVKETKTRDRVVERLKVLGAPSSELALIEEAKNKSDALIAIEDQAMKAVATSDLERARNLMFSDDYDRNKAVIMKPLAAFQQQMAARAAREVADAGTAAATATYGADALIALTCFGFAGILFFGFHRRVLQPLTRLQRATLVVADGRYNEAVPDTTREDEIGELARAVDVLRTGGIERVRLEQEQAEERRRKEAQAARLGEATGNFDGAVGQVLDRVAGALQELEVTADTLSTIVDSTARQATSAANTSQKTSGDVQTVAAAVEELSSTVAEVNRQVSNSTAMTARAEEQAALTGRTVQGLSEAATRIGDVVALISDVAAQTNLLALNATIEAARAGEAGKGFAVVASEVKGLATQTAKATEEIRSQIGAVQDETQRAVEAIARINDTMRELNSVAAAIAAAVEQQGAATNEIARSVRDAATGTNSVSDNVAALNQEASRTGAASTQLLTATRALTRQSDELNALIAGFLGEVRAA